LVKLGGVAAEIGELQRLDGPILTLRQEGEVEDPDQAAVDEVDQVWRDLPFRLLAGPLDQHVVDRPHLDVIGVHVVLS